MGLLSWRFGRTESADDYAGVLIPLTEAHLHSHSARSGKCEFESRGGSDGEGSDDGSGKDDQHEETGMLQMNVAEYTIEGLRRQVRQGERGQGSSEYECES
jgi:hypothetical protein